MPGENSGRILVFIRERREGTKREKESDARETAKKSATRGSLRGDGRRQKTTEAKYPSFCFVPRGWALSLRTATPTFPSPHAPSCSLSSIIIIFYHNICFSHILFYVNGRSLPLPAPSTSFPLNPSRPPRSTRRPHSTPDGRRFVCMASGNF